MGSPVPDAKERFLTVPMIAALAVCAILLAVPYLAFPEFGSTGNESSIQWLVSSWNKQTDYEHGWLVVPIIAFMLYHARKKIAQAPRRMDWRGLILFIPAALLLALSFRVGQPRVAVGALPLILLGGAWYLAGPQIARLCAFPLLFFWLCIPLPSFQQATVELQIVATELGHLGAALFGQIQRGILAFLGILEAHFLDLIEVHKRHLTCLCPGRAALLCVFCSGCPCAAGDYFHYSALPGGMQRIPPKFYRIVRIWKHFFRNLHTFRVLMISQTSPA